MEGPESTIHLSRLILTVVGIWPELHPSRISIIVSNLIFYVTATFIVYFLIIAQTWQIYFVGGNLDMIVDILCTADIPASVALMKMILLRYFSEDVKYLLRRITEDWKSPRTKEQLITMYKSAKIGRRVAAACTIIAFVSANLFFILRLYQLHKKTIQTGQRSLLFESHFANDVSGTPSFEITWIIQTVTVLSATTAYSGIDGFFAVLILHLCGQLNILKNELINIADDNNMTFDQRMREIVQRHMHLNWFAEGIEKTFSLMFLVQIFGCAVLFCLQGYQIVSIITDGSQFSVIHLIFLVGFVIYISVDFYIYCYVAEKLRSQSLEISEAAYNCRWYDLKPKECRGIMLISNRAQYPLEVTAGKFVALSLNLFAAVGKTSLGYLSMLLAVKERSSAN